MSDIIEFIDYLEKEYPGRISARVRVEAQELQTSNLELKEEVRRRLHSSGIKKLYSHQAEAVRHIRAGKNVILVSGTATGKTLAYQIPLAEVLVDDRHATALVLYPTKALARDQLISFAQLLEEALPAVYDGDTPASMRRYIRESSKVVLSNPDMLHAGILPNHALWADFFRNLRFVVLDEAHVYRGAYGSNVALVLRRLKRLAGLYGSSPQFILTSATVANPLDLAAALTGEEFELVSNPVLATAEKYFVFWEPPFNVRKNRRGSSNREAVLLFVEAVRRGLRTIVFSKSKPASELIIKYARNQLGTEISNRVAVYRAGLNPERRREIEKRLFAGDLLGVSATPALELGIDVGELTVAIINRFPGTISSFLQQSGRVGRKLPSVVFFVAGEDPVDQYYARNYERMLGLAVEEAVVDTENRYILEKHLLCASFEKSLVDREIMRYFGPAAIERAEEMSVQGILKKKNGRFYLSAEIKRPHERTVIRTAGFNNYQIVEAGSGEVLGFMDEPLAFIYLHPGAVYLYEGETYLVEDLDVERKVATVVPAEEINYYTQPKEDTRVVVESVERSRRFRRFDVYFGELTVTNHVIGYQRRNIFTDEVIGYDDVILPPHVFRTRGLWFVFDEELLQKLKLDPAELAGGIHGIEHAHIALLPVYANCDRWDIGGVSTPAHYETEETTIFIYDGIEGGIGFAEKGYLKFDRHIFDTLGLIENCPCDNGCPGCIQSPKCGNLNDPLDKIAAIKLLREHLR